MILVRQNVLGILLTLAILLFFGMTALAGDRARWADRCKTPYYDNERRYPVFTYERYSPGGYPYPWSIIYYHPPAYTDRDRHYNKRARPTPVYRYERYSPGGYPYPWSRIYYYPPR